MKTIHSTCRRSRPWHCRLVATAPGWEANFGDAARQARAAQVIDPNAPSRNTGLGTTDGKAVAGAKTAIRRVVWLRGQGGQQPHRCTQYDGGR